MFVKAEKRQARLKLAITGPSGSGKTYSALSIAKGIGKKIALIDTENASASLYSDLFSFDVLEISQPFTIQKYITAMREAVKAGYDVLVVDSLTHEWSGAGGLLEQKEILDSRGKGNSYTNWSMITKQHEQFMAEIVQIPIHLIGTIRSKQDYILQDQNGKQVPKKVGMAPVQRDGAEYEFTVVFDMAMNHTAEVSKDRTGLFDGKIFTPNEETGKTLFGWLNSGKAEAQKTPAVEVKTETKVEDVKPCDEWKATQKELNEVMTIVNDKRKPNQWTPGQFTEYLKFKFNKDKLSQLTRPEYDDALDTLKTKYVSEAMVAPEFDKGLEFPLPGADV